MRLLCSWEKKHTQSSQSAIYINAYMCVMGMAVIAPLTRQCAEAIFKSHISCSGLLNVLESVFLPPCFTLVVVSCTADFITT